MFTGENAFIKQRFRMEIRLSLKEMFSMEISFI